MREIVLTSLRTHTRRYVAASIAVVVGVLFIVTTAGLTSAAKSGVEAGVAKPVAEADAVASDVDGEDLRAIMAAARSDSADVAVLGWFPTDLGRDGQRIDDYAMIGHTGTGDLDTLHVDSGRVAVAAGEASVETSFAEANDIAVGDRITVGSADQRREVTVVGLVDAVSSLARNDVYLTWADLDSFRDELFVFGVAWHGAGSGADQVDQLADLLPDATIQDRDEYVAATTVELNQGVDAVAVLLLLFASITLFVSVIVIANTFSILFAQRRRDFALMRCVGATRRQVLGSIRLEALVLGLASSLVGIGLGVLSARGLVALIRRLAPDAELGAVAITPAWYLGAFTVGVLVTLIAAWLPTRRAVRVTPLAALRPETDEEIRSTGRFRTVLGLIAAVLVGPALLVVAIRASNPEVMMAGGIIVFSGILLLGPLLMPALIRAAGAITTPAFGLPGRLSVDNATRNPRRTAATTASLLVGVTLTTAILTGLSNSREAVAAELDGSSPIDGAITATDEPLDESTLTRARSIEGADDALLLNGAIARIDGIGEDPDSDPGTNRGVPLLETPSTTVDRSDALAPRPGQIRLPNELAEGVVKKGEPVTVRIGDHTLRLRVVLGDGFGASALVAPGTLDQLGIAPEPLAVWVSARDGADAEAFKSQLDAVASSSGAQTTVGLTERAGVDTQFDVLTWSVVGLLGIAIAIALVGIANTLGLSVLERTRELALLRALGLTRRQLRLMLATEAVLLAVVATVLGTVLGVTFAWVGIEVLIAPYVDAGLSLPVGQLAIVIAVSVAAGLLACVLPSRRAAKVAPAAGLVAD